MGAGEGSEQGRGSSALGGERPTLGGKGQEGEAGGQKEAVVRVQQEWVRPEPGWGVGTEEGGAENLGGGG